MSTSQVPSSPVVDALSNVQFSGDLIYSHIYVPYTAQPVSFPVVQVLSTAQVPSSPIVDAPSTAQVLSSSVIDVLSSAQVPSSPVVDAPYAALQS